MSARVLAGAAAGAVLLAAGATWLVLASEHEDNPAATLAFALTAGLSFVASGLVALWRRPENRTGVLLLTVGYLWFLNALVESNNDWVFTIGIALSTVVFGAFVHLLLAFPWGKLGRRRDAYLVVATYALTLLGSVALLLVEERPDPDCATCLSTLAVTNDATAQTVTQLTVTGLALLLIGAILATVGRRFRRSSPALRRVLGPVIVTGALAMLLAVGELAAGIFSDRAAEQLELLFLATFATVPIAFLAGVLRARLARSAVGELLLDLAAGGASLRDALARALHDPSLDIVYWLPQREQFVWHDGNVFVDEGGPRTARYVELNGKRVAALLHDPSLADEPELVDAAAAAAGLWLANEQLQAELRAQYDFLETIVNTAPSLLMSLELDGRIANFNTACERASGYENIEEVRNQYFWDVFISAEERDAVRERFLADPEHLPSDYENAFVNRRGEELVIAWSTAPLRDEHGEVRNIICGGLDVTERKRRELELQGERDFLDAMGDSIPSLIVLTDREGQIVSDGVNHAFRETFGWTTDETTRRSFLQFVHPDDDYAARHGDRCRGKRGRAHEASNRAGCRAKGSRCSSPGPPPRSAIRATRSSSSSPARTPPSASVARARSARARSGCARRSRLRRSRSWSTRSTTRSPAGTGRPSGSSAGAPRRCSAALPGINPRSARPSSPSSSGASATARSTRVSRAGGFARTER